MNENYALIIEDDEDLAIIFSEALKAAGFKTEIIKDGKVATERLYDPKLQIPDVVVLDLHLPHVSGMDILQQIRADERLTETRVLLATADASMAEMLEKKADLVLLKPVSFVQLRALAARFGKSQS
ncbi:MAG: response regulator transcription factor [Anaerolineae bacterium]|nr:response regulator transcription factor [Anaerolineae bacterium]